jgi:D-arabinose 1-dehydrogenase-like Zn-dependent alcohol dehydrogenase
MKKMKAVQVSKPGAGFEIVERDVPAPKENEVLIRVQACGICHGDALALEGNYPGLKYPIIPGHEVVGIIESVGSLDAKIWHPGQRVGVGWHGGHCGQCMACQRGDTWNCEQSLTTGLSCDGGYAEYMIARKEAVFSIPQEYSSVQAAPLLCAGNTVFGALKNCGAKGGEIVAVAGIGGLGHLAIQYARKLGYKTVALSRGQDKKPLALELGAHVHLDTSSGQAAKELQKLGGAQVILCTAPNSKLISELLPGLARGGKMIIVSFSRGVIEIPHYLLLGGTCSISGWVGGRVDEALHFSALVGVKPMIEEFPLARVEEAFKKMMDSTVHFRAVLTMGDQHV